MTLAQLLESIDLPCLVGFLGFLALLAWLQWIDGGPWVRDPEPRMDCVAKGGKDAWTVSAGYTRHT